MEKYCTKCGSVFKDENVKFCSKCGHELSERPGRQHIPKGLRHAVFKRDGYRCQECFRGREDGVKLEIDHIIPVAKGGTNEIDNLQTLCMECNRNKHTNEWIAGETDLTILENEYSKLLNQKREYEEKLDIAITEDDKIDCRFNILKIKETLNKVRAKIDELYLKKAELERQQEKREKKDKLFKKLYITFTDPQLKLLHEEFNNVPYSRDELLRYLVDNYSEYEINNLIKRLEEKYEFSKKLYSTLKSNELELLYDNFRFVDRSITKLVDYLSENYYEEEINKLIVELQKEKEEKNFISNNISDSMLKLLFKKFPQVTPSKKYMVNYLHDNYYINEFNQLLVELQKEKEERDNIYNQISEGVLLLLYNEFPQINSKENMADYLYENCSEVTINQLLTRLQKEAKILQKQKLLKGKLSNVLSNSQLKLLYYKFPNVIHSKESMITFLSENYSEDEINQMLVNLEKELPKVNNYGKTNFENYKLTEVELKQKITSEHLELLGLLDPSYKNKDYMVAWFPMTFTGNQINEILSELDNINNQLNELNNQKDNANFCILGFNNVWYYYYITSNGEYNRFYAFSKSELEQLAFSKNLPWYKRFIYSCSSKDNRVKEFIGQISSNINIEVVGIPNECYSSGSINTISSKARSEVISKLNVNLDNEPSEELFKPTIILSEHLPENIICPNCGSRIKINAVRCKSCKTMMNDLIEEAGGKLELWGLDPNEIKIIEKDDS